MDTGFIIIGAICILIGLCCLLSGKADFVLFQFLPDAISAPLCDFFDKESTPVFYYFVVFSNFLIGGLLVYLGIT